MALFRALISLVHLRGGDPKLIKELNSYASDVDGPFAPANRIVHDPWLIASRTLENQMPVRGDVARIEVTADRKLVFYVAFEPVSKIEDLVAEIDTSRNNFFEFMTRISALPPYIPKTPPEEFQDTNPAQESDPDSAA